MKDTFRTLLMASNKAARMQKLGFKVKITQLAYDKFVVEWS